MKTGKLTACVCCAGLVLLSGCAADNGQEACLLYTSILLIAIIQKQTALR